MWKWPKCAGTCGTAAVILKGRAKRKSSYAWLLPLLLDAAHLGGELGLSKASYRPAIVGEFLSSLRRIKTLRKVTLRKVGNVKNVKKSRYLWEVNVLNKR